MAEKLYMIALSPTMESGQLTKWLKNKGNKIGTGDIICEVETDKATMEYESPIEGTLLEILLSEGESAKVGDVIAILGEEGEDITPILHELKNKSHLSNSESSSDPNIKQEESYESASQKGITDYNHIKSSPLARKIALKHHIDLKTISGSGPDGRIIKRDVENAIHQSQFSKPFSEEHIKISNRSIPVSEKRRIIAKRLSESKYNAPHYYLTISAYMDDIITARKRLNSTLNEKLTLNSFLIKFAAEAIKRHPIINSSWQGDSIEQFGSIDIGLAVAQPDGLITPIVKDCANKGIVEINQELQSLIEKAINNRLTLQEYTGATFTISNLGSFGIKEFTAIINPPGSAILAIGEIKKVPVIQDNDEMVIQSEMIMTLSCDHRVIDGAQGANFLKKLKDMLENPIYTLL